ncbi:glycoside hydrolase family 31 protein [Flavitalea flava]
MNPFTSKPHYLLPFLLTLLSLVQVQVQAQVQAQAQEKSKDNSKNNSKNYTNNSNTSIVEHSFNKTSRIRIEMISANILRISIVPEGGVFQNSGLNRYGFINLPDSGIFKPQISQTSQGFLAQTADMRVKINYVTGNIHVTDPEGSKVLLDQSAATFDHGTTEVVFKADKEEDWIGFGDQSRTHLYHRGYMADCDVRYKTSTYIPVPYFMSTKGVGVLVNTTYHTIFDMCKTKPDTYNWKNESGTIDYYIMVGKDFKQLLNTYTHLTGRPRLPPQWAFGLWFICRDQADDMEAVTAAYNFRHEKIPCDVIGLEPGWMEGRYDYSTKKQWSSIRFPHLYWFNETRPPSFVPALKKMGFKLELWLCNNYDLSYEAERQAGRKANLASLANGNKANATPPLFQDEHLGGHVFSDTVTIIDQPWFKHLEKFVDQGVDFFKQDAAVQMEFHPDRLWGNGMKDKEMHNLYPLLYSQQMYDGFKAKTNRRPAALTPAGWTGFQAFSATWTGDTGGELTTLGGILNTSIVGQSWSTVDMEVGTKEGIHYGYLLPFSEICSWAYFKMPWVQGEELKDLHRSYAELRSRLFPYLYSSARMATKTGWPLLQPLTIVYPEDKNCRENLHQYLLGPGLMVGIYKKDMYFPAGEWKDYWTGGIIAGSQQKDITWPDNKGGALYIHSGSIIPMGPVVQYRGEKPMDEITLYVFPDQQETSFDLYEDDGVSFDYEKGNYSTTRITAKKTAASSIIEIGKTQGTFENSVKHRTWSIIMHMSAKPLSVSIDGILLKEDQYTYDDNRKELTIRRITTSGVVSIREK